MRGGFEMKRIASFLLAVMLLFVCNVSFADENESVKSKQLETLNKACLFYDLIPDGFDADKIMHTYLSFMIYMNSSAMEYFYQAFAVEEETGIKAADRVLKVAGSSAKMTKAATDGYLDWLNGNMTDAQYADVLMTLVKGVIASENE